MGANVSASIGNDARLRFEQEVLVMLEGSFALPKWTDQALNIIDLLEKFVNDAAETSENAERLRHIKGKLGSLWNDLDKNLPRLLHPDTGAPAPENTPKGWEQFPNSKSAVATEGSSGVKATTSVPITGPDWQTQEMKSKTKHSADSVDRKQVADLEKQLQISEARYKHDVTVWTNAYWSSREESDKLWRECKEREQQLLNSKSQIDNLAAQEASNKNQLRGKIAALEDQRDELQKQLRSVESQKGKEAGAKGLYHDSGATPADLLKVAEEIKVSSKNFSKELSRFGKKEWREDKLQALRTQEVGIKLAKAGHVQFWIQCEIVSIAFRQLWDSRFFSLRSCPHGSDVSESQQYWYHQYLQVRDDADQIPKLLDLSAAQLAVTDPKTAVRCYRKTCVATKLTCHCGGADFVSFCYSNLNQIERLDIWRLVPPRHVVGIQQSFVAFLTDVWLAHLLALSFEQPACLYKVEQGKEFAKAIMESAVLQDGEEQSQAQRKVEFMIIPGFRVGRTVIKSQVYLDAST